MNNLGRNKGITLIALVVTIVVLMILAGVSVSMLTGQNGIINTAGEAKTKTEEAGNLEYVQTVAYEALLSYYGSGSTLSENEYVLDKLGKENGNGITTNLEQGTLTYKGVTYSIGNILGKNNEQKAIANNKLEEVIDSPLLKEEGTTIRSVLKETTEDGKELTAVIPVGFYYVTGTPSTGLVISDINGDDENNSKGGNQFVWVPCGENGVTYEKENGLAKTWNANYSSYQYFYKNVPNYTDSNGNVTNGGADILDCWTDNGGNKESVKKYGGFYVGRYEAGVPDNAPFYANKEGDAYSTDRNKDTYIPVSKKGTQSWNYISQLNSVKVSENMYKDSNSVDSSLIDSYAWDTIVEWMKKNGKSVTNSTDYGNYQNNSSIKANALYSLHILKNLNEKGTQAIKDGKLETSTAGWKVGTSFGSKYKKGSITTGNKGLTKDTYKDYDVSETIFDDWEYYTYTLYKELATGASEETKVNNIYDMAGNMWEWTTETGVHVQSATTTATSTYAVIRGGSFLSSGSYGPVSRREGHGTTGGTGIYLGFRVVLYIK